MRVLIDATGVYKGGMQTYFRGLARAWADSESGDALSVVATDDLNPATRASVGRLGQLRTIGRGSFRNRIAAQQALVPRLAAEFLPDVVFCLVPVVPLRLHGFPIVCVAHDFRHLHRPQEFSRPQVLYRRFLYRRSLIKADLAIANSEATARDVRAITGGRQQNVQVIYMGTEHPAEPAAWRSGSDYALAFGHWSNKQPDMAIKAWGELRRLIPGLDTRLRIVGVPEEDQPALAALSEYVGVDDLVTVEGFVPDDRYWPMFTGARLILLPSTFEGFGMPVVEALAHGIPVVTSRGVGLEEAGGDYVLYADPSSPVEFADCCASILTDPDATAERIRSGLRHAKSFTWENALAQTRAALQRAIDRNEVVTAVRVASE